MKASLSGGFGIESLLISLVFRIPVPPLRHMLQTMRPSFINLYGKVVTKDG